MNPILLDLGFFEIRWYSLLILTAFIIGYLLIINRAKKKKLSLTNISDLCFYLIIVCILGARVYYCAFNLDYYSIHPLDIFKIWEGGLAIHGGIIAGIIFIIIYTRKKKLSALEIFDIFAPALVLGQAIGRWGNFFNSEAYGPATTLYHLKSLHIPEFIINGMNIDGIYYHPTFFYESLGCILIFVILIILRNFKGIKIGQITSIYFVLYGIVRFIIESLRQDSLMLFDIKVAQLISILMIITGLIIFINSYTKLERKVK